MAPIVTGLIEVQPDLWLAWQRAGSAPSHAPAVRRQQQSAQARQAAARALARLGVAMPSLAGQPSGAPDFGADLRGSLAHADRFAAALVGQATDWAAVGVDIEPAGPMPQDALDFALDAVEQAALAALPGGLARWALAAFGLKECLHKCLSPLHGLTLEFDEVRVQLTAGGRLLSLSARSERAREALEGALWVGGVHAADGATLSWLAGPA